MLNNVVLVGMPGSGKSTVGVVLAKKLGMKFLDSDLLIQEQELRLLSTILEMDGLEGFLKIENQVNAEINVNQTVIATGGSVVYGEKAMKHLKQIGKVVYLKLSLESIAARLGDLHDRGVALKENQTLEDLYYERIPLYEKYADLVCDCEELEIRDVVNLVIKALNE